VVRNNLISLVFVSAVLASLSGVVQASKVVSCTGKSNIDFGDAPDSYGAACHQTKEWQKLGKKWSEDSASNDVDSDNASDDGVKWRTFLGKDAANKNTWTEWSSTASLTQGDKVQFRFNLRRANYGNHQFDELKAWIDWDNDYNWSNDDEVLINKQWRKNQNRKDKDLFDSSYNNDLKTNNNSDTWRNYKVNITIPLDATLGDTWMRARVVCENSLTKYSDNYMLIATGFQDQGEVEDYKLTIVAKNSPTPVPEPSTLFIFTLGLLTLGLKRRKTIKNS